MLIPCTHHYRCAPCQHDDRRTIDILEKPDPIRASGVRNTGRRAEPMPSADLVGDRPITGSARDYADPNWAAVGLVAATKQDSTSPIPLLSNLARPRVTLGLAAAAAQNL
jgi:hypothetical protein